MFLKSQSAQPQPRVEQQRPLRENAASVELRLCLSQNQTQSLSQEVSSRTTVSAECCPTGGVQGATE